MVSRFGVEVSRPGLSGDIVSYDPETGCYQQVTYEDGDKEGLSRASVQAGVRRFQAQAK